MPQASSNAPARPRVVSADWLIAMDPDVPGAIRNGGVRIGDDGLIAAVGPVDDIRAPGDELIHHADAVLTPGLISCHAHLDMSYWAGRRDGLAGRPLHEWVVPIMGERLIRPPADIAAAAARGAADSLAAGVTTVVDITPASIAWADVLEAVATVPVRRIALAEVIGYGARADAVWSDAVAALKLADASLPPLSVGLSPHAPYSTEPALYERALAEAKRHGRVLATHLAETLEEVQFTEAGTGPWRKLIERVSGDFPRDFDAAECSPVALADRLGLLAYDRTLLVHVNHLRDGDLERLAAGRASVVYCPRTADFFGHRGHRWREMLAAGVNVAVGTDSLASSPDLSVLGELAFLHAAHPEVPATTLFALATTNAARAIGRAGELGVLKVGARADIAAWPLQRSSSSDSADAILTALLGFPLIPRVTVVG
ncbi:MAG: 5'-deoxyadenosine deaminase [Phycisphaerae bacterium]|nr:5'-deoxyadenosine deaminase [Phycisphaerae bacterium]